MKRVAVMFALALPLAACGGSKTNEGATMPGGPSVEFPEWVMKGSGAFGGEKKVFYGVGAASGSKNPAMLRSMADQRGRAEIGRVMETYTASLMKDYMSTTATGDMSTSSDEQHVEQAIKTFSATTLNGVEIVDHWIHPTEGTMYALARLDIGGFMDQIDKAKELSGKVKEAVKRAAAKSFADLEAEEAKKEAKEAATE